MKKPKPVRPTKHNDVGVLLEALEIALEHVYDAMDEIKGYDELSDLYRTLDYLHDDMYSQYEGYEIIAQAEHDEMIRDLTKEYYRGLL